MNRMQLPLLSRCPLIYIVSCNVLATLLMALGHVKTNKAPL